MEFYEVSNTNFMKIKRLLIAISVIIVSIAVTFSVAFFIITNPRVKIAGWSSLDLNKLDRIHYTATLKDASGNIIADGIYSKNRIYTPLSQVPKWTRDAFISVEDKRFYKHNGVDYLRMLGAAKNNMFSARLKEGGSTITQQLIKNTHLTNEKTFSRKFQEIRIAKQLEKVYSKEQILEAYLNILYFGNNTYGIGQAAKVYFDKEVSELDVSESAMLAGIINNPQNYNPLINYEASVKRKNIVLERMAKNGKLGEEELNVEKNIKPKIVPYKRDPLSVYVENAVCEAADVLHCSQEELFELRPSITVGFDSMLFKTVSNSMSDILLSENNDVRVLVLENSSGDVLCDLSNMSGIYNMKRQPGSAIKPFVSYAPALEKKLVYTASVIKDEPTDFNGYSPKNFGDKYYGNVTVSDSLSKSLNIPAVKLTEMCGVPYSKSVASRFGISFSDKDNGLAVALGGLTDGVTLNSLADAYATLANGGSYVKSGYVTAVSAGDECLYKKSSEAHCAVSDDTAFLITDMLMRCANEGTAKKLSCFGNVAAKTGTVERGEKNSDAYCIAYTPKYTVAVWYGNDNGKNNVYGGNQPAAVAKTVLGILNDTSRFSMPQSVEKLTVDIKKLYDEGVVYLASPLLQKRYCADMYFSKNNIPKRFSYTELPFIFDESFESGDFDNFEIVDGFCN